MRIFRHYQGIPDADRGAVVAVGNFDGLHRGHQAVIAAARAEAAARGVAQAVLTFDPHPRRYFRPAEPPFELTPLTGKLRVLEGLGVDQTFALHFDAALAALPAQAFIDQVLVEGLGASHVVCGHDFVFGAGRAGNADLLRAAAPAAGFGVTVVDAIRRPDGVIYSSTTIRDAIRAGDVQRAAELLGRCWEVEGRVQHGDERGRTIGFPTANLVLGSRLEPLFGVYAVWAGVERGERTEWHQAVSNVGRRPTFDGQGVTVETYIFDFARDIYGERLRVALAGFIRPERKFDGIEAIRAQIAEDCRTAREVLAGMPAGSVLGPPDAALQKVAL